MHFPNLKISWRTHQRQPLFTLVNILGLAVALSVVILIAVYVRSELSYDAHWKDSDRIYRINGTWITETGEEISSPTSVPALAITLPKQIPGVESAVRIVDWSFTTPLSSENASAMESVPMADTTLFDVFSINLITGDPKTALYSNLSVIIDESTARKYFGEENPVGRHLDTEQDTFYTVTGVFEDITRPTHLRKYKLFTGMPRGWVDDDYNFDLFNTYVKLQDGIDPNSLKAALDSLIQPHVDGFFYKKGKEYRLDLQPIRDIHLYSTLANQFSCCEDNTTPAIENIRLFAGVGILILVIACLNFVNLSTARSAGRGKQVGIAKVAGATRNRLFRSFMLESIAVTAVSMSIALFLATLFLKRFATIIGANPDIIGNIDLTSIIILSVFTVIVGAAAGFYPAIFLSGFRPVQVLKGTLNLGMKGMRLRAALVIIQFTISAALITGMLIVRSQVKYIFNKPLGYDIDNVLISEVSLDEDWSRDAFIDQLRALPGVLDLSTSSHIPLMPGLSSTGLGKCLKPGYPEEKISLNTLLVGIDFPKMMKMNLLSGRWFNPEESTGKSLSIIINESMAKVLGFDDPVGKTIQTPYHDSTRTRTIVGLVKDFHWKSLHSRIESAFLKPDDNYSRYLLIRYNPLNLPEILTSMQGIWDSSGPPDSPFNYRLMEDIYRQIHLSDTRFQELFVWLTALAIFIACLGLFALVTYAVERRTKEIGIRKTLGASAGGIVLLLSREFIILVLLSNLIAAPLAYYFMRQWLDKFVYRIPLEPMFFFAAAGITLLIALLTVAIQAYRAALRNPVDSLRTE